MVWFSVVSLCCGARVLFITSSLCSVDIFCSSSICSVRSWIFFSSLLMVLLISALFLRRGIIQTYCRLLLDEVLHWWSSCWPLLGSQCVLQFFGFNLGSGDRVHLHPVILELLHLTAQIPQLNTQHQHHYSRYTRYLMRHHTWPHKVSIQPSTDPFKWIVYSPDWYTIYSINMYIRYILY